MADTYGKLAFSWDPIGCVRKIIDKWNPDGCTSEKSYETSPV